MTDLHAAKLVTVIALVTIALRFLPFLIFSGKRQTPAYISYLGKVLPFSIMGMLVVYCLRNISFSASPFGIPELLSCAIVAGLHLWKRNTLLSIAGGTVFYMLLVQTIF
ncbi:MAG: branched-chain amino acid transporter permease [Anaerotignum sp.]|nr:branched-chain amino acid transporter permease [Anaerotignum sp.]